MADSILFNLAGNIITKLGSFAIQELGLLWGVHDELHKLKATVSAIDAVLLDAEEQQFKSHAVKDWISKLKDAFYDIDDLMDEFSYESLRRQVMTKHRPNTKQVRIFFSKSNQIAFLLKMGQKIKTVREKLDAIARDKAQLNLIENTREIRVDESTKLPETSSFILEGEVIGRDGDRKRIVDFLLDTNTEMDNVKVIAIIGMGGLGKTALAQSIYGDEKVKEHFELTMWVCISEEFDVKVIVEKIIESLTKMRPEPNLQLNTLQSMLREKIDGKKYLLVMDDVWNVNHEKWISLKRYLMGGAKGSRILITTRSHQVAETSETVLFHDLKELDKDNSWELFRKMAFSNESEELENSKLVVIGKEIVAKLKGSPLAIRIIGRLLYSKRSEKDYWLSFKENELRTVMQKENEIQSILKISFNHLSSSLKQCFTYCALFPKDYEIQKDELIKQWMAQGFIQPHSKKAIEDVGDDYFKELLGRSFFQDIRKNKRGEIKEFKMHDFMHDLACSVGENDFVLVHDDTMPIDKGVRHVTFPFYLMKRWKLIAKSLIEAKNLRTLNTPHVHGIDLSNHLRLRTLNSEYFDSFPKCIGKMKHLRYVNLSNISIHFLPKFFTKLYHLETLILRNCYLLRGLPGDIKNLINLRHLDIMHCNSNNWTHMPIGLGSMTSLQTMNLFVLGKNKGSKLSELNGLNSLRGSLKIRHLQFCKSSDLENAKYLEEKFGIQKLELHWDRESKIDNALDDEDEKVLEGLKPHPNLHKIHIEGFKGVKLCNWLSFDSISSLVTIKLRNCEKLQHLPRFDQFPFLKHLHLEELSNIEYIDNNNFVSSSTNFFPSLEKLSIISMPNLKGWWKGEMVTTNIIVGEDSSSTNVFRSLSSLSISEMDFEFLPHDLFCNMTHLKSLHISHCKNLKMSSDHDDVIWKELESLHSLKLTFIPKLEYLPKGFQYMTAVEHLILADCPNLVCIEGIEHLTSLSSLTIFNCPSLTSLPQEMGQLTSLSSLTIIDCPNLTSLPQEMGQLTSLSSLGIFRCPNLTSLPQEMDQVTSLSSLTIDDITNLISLPQEMRQLTSLSSLTIIDCPNLTSLPQEMGQLTSLSSLIIIDCPNLTFASRDGSTHLTIKFDNY